MLGKGILIIFTALVLVAALSPESSYGYPLFSHKRYIPPRFDPKTHVDSAFVALRVASGTTKQYNWYDILPYNTLCKTAFAKVISRGYSPTYVVMRITSHEVSAGYILADAGYDVWLGNFRGNTYSRRHVTLSTDSKEFWEFSFDEMALYDLPAMIDFALNKTGETQLYYIGHSQGTLTAFALLSEKPEYNEKLRTFFALAPVATVGYIKSPIRYFAPYTKDIEILLKLLGVKEFLPNSWLIKLLSDLVCTTEIKVFCEEIIFLIVGVDPDQMNSTRLPVYLSHTPAGTSSQNLVHFAQLVNSKKLLKYDYGKHKNMKKYNQPTPPEYFIENMTTPVALFWAQDDWLADPRDIALLQPRLKHMIKSYMVEYAKWSHVDFIWGIEARKYVYDELLKMLQKTH
ncbi:gastric triacylglycerol lipase-like [Limulus polyphemus]|uniref:Gastric triacylglycerol lipase-like n=1 Tax=Limulus polyphemus TaxID=6850 RepID=A0ABM1TL92_LIMPO|nr:gastric triacylglycerol lipase-like [Limulus polyphemus]